MSIDDKRAYQFCEEGETPPPPFIFLGRVGQGFMEGDAIDDAARARDRDEQWCQVRVCLRGRFVEFKN